MEEFEVDGQSPQETVQVLDLDEDPDALGQFGVIKQVV